MDGNKLIKSPLNYTGGKYKLLPQLLPIILLPLPHKNEINTFVDLFTGGGNVVANKSFTDLKVDKLSKDDYVYCDPPYLITCASYNEQDGWNETQERQLYELLDNLSQSPQPKGWSFCKGD